MGKDDRSQHTLQLRRNIWEENRDLGNLNSINWSNNFNFSALLLHLPQPMPRVDLPIKISAMNTTAPSQLALTATLVSLLRRDLLSLEFRADLLLAPEQSVSLPSSSTTLIRVNAIPTLESAYRSSSEHHSLPAGLPPHEPRLAILCFPTP